MKYDESEVISRILPDICVLISHTISRIIKLGYLENFQIVIPDSMEYIVQILCDERLQAGFYNEINKLKELEAERKINLLFCSYGIQEFNSKKELIKLEDDLILEIAVATDSILFTSDKGLRDKAASIKQPVIYFPAKFQRKIKENIRESNFHDLECQCKNHKDH